jgi:EAL domain-containing protein (putative c-di-GMP-specific phosphodiesterase class I)
MTVTIQSVGAIDDFGIVPSDWECLSKHYIDGIQIDTLRVGEIESSVVARHIH